MQPWVSRRCSYTAELFHVSQMALDIAGGHTRVDALQGQVEILHPDWLIHILSPHRPRETNE